MLLADLGDDPVGFVSGIEITHPDKGTEMLLYELGIDEPFRRRGFGTALVRGLLELADDLGCVAMWVPIDRHDTVAEATYRSAGAEEAEPASLLTWDLTS